MVYRRNGQNMAKTATQREILPVQHGHGRGAIRTDDETLTIEALRIAEEYIVREANACAVIMPASAMVERLTQFAENMRELRERLDA